MTAMHEPSAFAEQLRRACEGDAAALEALLPAVYGELRQIAARQMRQERPDHTLQPTALVHEAYLQLFADAKLDVTERAHFMALAARVMRRLLINHAQARNADKRRGNAPHVTLSAAEDIAEASAEVDLEMLDECLRRLAALDPRGAQVVELRYFGGMTIEEIGEAMALSPATVKREWTVARAWLKRELSR